MVAAVGKPLVTNVLRGLLVEAMVAIALEPVWTWVAGDYASWDFEGPRGLRLEVKQSAARQSWADENVISKCSFDIAPRTGPLSDTAEFPLAGGRNFHDCSL